MGVPSAVDGAGTVIVAPQHVTDQVAIGTRLLIDRTKRGATRNGELAEPSGVAVPPASPWVTPSSAVAAPRARHVWVATPGGCVAVPGRCAARKSIHTGSAGCCTAGGPMGTVNDSGPTCTDAVPETGGPDTATWAPTVAESVVNPRSAATLIWTPASTEKYDGSHSMVASTQARNEAWIGSWL